MPTCIVLGYHFVHDAEDMVHYDSFASWVGVEGGTSAQDCVTLGDDWVDGVHALRAEAIICYMELR